MGRSTVTGKGQITLPKAVREALGVTYGDRVAFHIHEDGTVTIEAETVDLRSLRGAIVPAVRGVTLEEMDEAIRRGGTRS
jgi:AbrB family looped-hinge helix DNA binding protein